MTLRRHRVPDLRIRGWSFYGLVAGDLRHALEGSVYAIPDSLLERLPAVTVVLVPALEASEDSSRWTESAAGLRVEIAIGDVSPHDCALELLLCAGQVLWDRLEEVERRVWLLHLRAEIDAGVPGEIDELPLREKRMLLSSRTQASSRRRLERYARQSFAATAAEYCHALWHDVGVRSGPEHLPAPWLRRRLELLARWFPSGRELFAPSGQGAGNSAPG